MYVDVGTENGVALITICRPEALNALNGDVLQELCAALDDLENDPDVKAMVITGSGKKAFVAGGDIAHMSRLSPQQAKEFSALGHRTLGKIASSKKPVIAAVNGYALGGGNELAMACDIRVASSDAVFGQPEVKLGIIAGFGGTQRLARLVNPGMAKEMLFTGEHYDAEAALRMGLVNKVVPAEELMKCCLGMARMIASRPAHAVRLTKEAVDQGLEMDMEKALHFEANLMGMAFADDAARAGLCGFLEEKRTGLSNGAP